MIDIFYPSTLFSLHFLLDTQHLSLHCRFIHHPGFSTLFLSLVFIFISQHPSLRCRAHKLQSHTSEIINLISSSLWISFKHSVSIQHINFQKLTAIHHSSDSSKTKPDISIFSSTNINTNTNTIFFISLNDYHIKTIESRDTSLPTTNAKLVHTKKMNHSTISAMKFRLHGMLPPSSSIDTNFLSPPWISWNFDTRVLGAWLPR